MDHWASVFTDEDWQEIFYAVEDKRAKVLSGIYGDGMNFSEWAKQLQRVAETIAREVRV